MGFHLSRSLSQAMRSVSLLLAAAVLLASLTAATKLDHQSFEPPFEDIDSQGNRLVNKQWKSSGHAVVNTNFARLTPDRQSKKGALWSRKSIGVPVFSSILKFRISGQGKNFFGDGLALWMVQQGYYSEGTLHGFSEKFYGVGIIVDTFKNTENLAGHRDITVLVNDGEKTLEMMVEDVKGCAASLRYHAERADFSVTAASRIKIMVDENDLALYVDAKNEGEWVECITIDDMPLKKDWATRAYFGVTASTGALADNHDVIALSTFSDATVMEAEDSASISKREYDLNLKASTPDRLLKLEDTMNTILNRLNVMDHHLEHELLSVEDHIQVMGKKISERESSAEDRIENLEEKIKKQVDGTIAERLNVIERQLKGTVDRKITNVADSLERKLDVKVEKSATKAANTAATIAGNSGAGGGSGDWKIPFLMLLLLFVAGAIGFYRFYEKMKRSHIL